MRFDGQRRLTRADERSNKRPVTFNNVRNVHKVQNLGGSSAVHSFYIESLTNEKPIECVTFHLVPRSVLYITIQSVDLHGRRQKLMRMACIFVVCAALAEIGL